MSVGLELNGRGGGIAAGGTQHSDRQGLAHIRVEPCRRRLDPDLRAGPAADRVRCVQSAAGRRAARKGRVRIDGPQEQRFQSHRGRGRERGLRERGGTCHVGRRHRRPVEIRIRAAWPRRVDARPRRAEIDRPAPIVRKPGARVVLIRSGHGDDVREIEPRRIVRIRVVVLEAVSGRRDEERAVRIRIRNRILEGLGEVLPAPRVVRNDGAHARRVEDRADCVVCGSLAVRADELQRHDLDVPVDADDARPVVADRSDRPGDVRPVAVVVGRVIVVVHEVPAMDVVDVAVGIVVDPVVFAAWAGLSRIGPDVCGEIGVVPVHARVDHRNDDRVTPGRRRPRLWRVDVGVGRSGRAFHGLADVVQAPELREGWVVRKRVDAIRDVLFGKPNTRIAAELRERTPAVGSRHRREEGAKRADAAVRCHSRVAE